MDSAYQREETELFQHEELPTTASTNSDFELATDDLPPISIACFGELSSPTRYNNRNAKSSVWKFFQIYHDKKLRHLAYCQICKVDVNYTNSKSTGMLTRHL